ncbi:MAG TPA: DUF3352 domain-containing protein [Thermomicrobiales bacterium]|nr:DUF3352 domain-containing protein [Thermomicrobiales bacterium]
MELATARSTGPARIRLRARLAALAARAALVLTLLPVAGVVGIAAPARAQTPAAVAASTTAAAAPADSLAFFEAPLDESSAQWTLAQDLIQRAGFGSALDELRQDLTDSSGRPLPLDAFLGGEAGIVVSDAALEQAVEASGMAGPSMADISELLGTPAATTAPAAEAPAGWALILDARAPSTAFAGLSQAVADQASEAGGSVQQSTYQGVPISYAPGNGADVSGLATARVDAHVLLAQTPADLQSVIDTAQGTTPSIETVAAYTTIRQTLAGDHVLFGFLNGPAAAQAQGAIAGTGGALAVETRYTGLTISADQPGFRMETVSVSADGAPLPPGAAPAQSALLGRTPGDALFFLSAQDLAKTGILDALGAVALGTMSAGFGAAATPPPGESPEEFIARQYEGMAALLGFNPQTDLFQQLVGEYGLWVRAQADTSTMSALFVSGVKDPGTVANALAQVTMLIQGNSGGAMTATTRTVAGSRITTLPGEPGTPPIEYGVIGDQLVVGVGDAIDRFASANGPSLADNAQYQAVMATLPTTFNGSLYLDLTQLVPLAQASEEASSDAASNVTGLPAVRDASPDCADYPDQAAAQKAYDALETGTFDLDQNFNGVVCEDFFATPAPAAPAATPAMETGPQLASSALKAFALVAYDQDGMRRTSSILYIEGAGS